MAARGRGVASGMAGRVPAGATPAGATPAGGARPAARAFLELFTLSGLAVLQPLLDLLDKNAEIFVIRRVTLGQTVALVALVALVPPLLGTLVEVLVAVLRPSAVRAVHALLCAVLVGVLALESVKQATTLSGTALVVLAIVLGAVGAFLVVRFALVRQFLHVLAIAPVLFALLFLTNSKPADVLSGGGAAAASTATASSPHRVVLVVLDELPEMSLLDGHGRIDAQLFPHFADLASHSTWYRNTSTVSAFTAGAVPAILTGRYPVDRSKLAVASAYPRNLFTMLGSGYEMNVHEAVTHLCPDDLCATDRAQDFGGLLHQAIDLWSTFASPNDEKVVQDEVDQARRSITTARSFVASIAPSQRPRLDFVHLEAPHFPWDRTATLQRYAPLIPATDPESGAALTTAPYFVWPASVAPIGRQAHLLQVQAVDTLVGDVLERLRTTGVFDDALVIVTADHGAAFTPGEPLRNPSAGNLAEITWPPLFVKYPKQSAGRVDDRPARTTDILPTIADVVGLRRTWPFDGRSLRSVPRPEGPRRLYPWVYSPGPRDLDPPPGRAYLEVDGAKGFARVLRASAAPAGGDPRLRLYRIGPYGGLVGRDAAGLVRSTPSGQTVTLETPGRWDDVDRRAADLPWFANQATIGPVTGSEWVAAIVNGRVAAVALAVGARGSTAPFSFLVAPDLVRDGHNDVTFAVVRGTPEQPALRPARAG